MVQLSGNDPKVVEYVETGRTYLDGAALIGPQPPDAVCELVPMDCDEYYPWPEDECVIFEPGSSISERVIFPDSRTHDLATVADGPGGDTIITALATLMATPDLCSRRWIWEQYDHTVMGDTVIAPGGDAALEEICLAELRRVGGIGRFGQHQVHLAAALAAEIRLPVIQIQREGAVLRRKAAKLTTIGQGGHLEAVQRIPRDLT